MPITSGAGDSAQYFGRADYNEAKAQGYSDRQIKAHLDSNPGLLRGGNVPGAGGGSPGRGNLYDQIAVNVSGGGSSGGSSGGGGGGGPDDVEWTGGTPNFNENTGGPPDGGGGPPQGLNHSGISYAAGGSDRYFGHHDYISNKAAGYTDQQIKSYLDANPNLLRNHNVPGGGRSETGVLGIYDQISNSISNASQQPSLDTELSDYRDQLNDYSQQISSMGVQYGAALGDVNRLSGEVQDWTNRFNASQAQYEAARAQADAYREESVGRQLSGLRTGATGAGYGRSAHDPYALTSGTPRYSSGSPGGRRLVNIEQEADSVLSRRGPVVHPIRSGATRSESSSRERRAPTGSVNRSYYSRRFR